MRLLLDQIHLKIRNAADRIALLDHPDAEVEIVEIW